MTDAVILVGGQGKRLGKITLKTPIEVHDHLTDYLSQPNVTLPPMLGTGLKGGGLFKGAMSGIVTNRIEQMGHNFIAGKPLFGTLICLIINNVPSMGIIDIPVLGERWTGVKGNGVHKNNKLCCFDKKKKKLKDAILASTSLLMFNQKETKVIKRIYEKIRFPVFGTDCYAYGLLLSGKIDLIIESKMKPWDYMAQVSLIKEFGGIISDWSGKELTPKSSGDVIASYSEECYQEAIKYLAKIK